MYRKSAVFKVIGAAALAAFLCAGCEDYGYTLSIEVNPPGGGKVSRDPEGPAYSAGDTVTVTAEANKGYEFVSWSGALNSAARYVAVPMNSDVKLTANFRPAEMPQTVSYTVAFDANGGSGAPPGRQTVSAGSAITLPNQGGLTKNGYDFGGWNTAGSGAGANYRAGSSYKPDSSVTLYAKWNSGSGLKTYTIKFDANGGTVSPAAGATDADGKLESLPAPARSGYAHKGWFTAAAGGSEVTTNTVFNKDTTVYAQWAPGLYRITFDANGGAVTPDTGTTGADGKLKSLPAPARDGYFFKGWFTAETGGAEVKTSTVFTADAVIYARWIVSYTVDFDANGGTVSPAAGATGDGGKLASLPAPARDGYTFNGWYTAESGGAKVTASTVFSDGAIIYAQWTLITYTITFNANGGTVSPSSGATGDGWKLAYLPAPMRAGYRFDGWYTSASGGESVTENRVYGSNVTIFARWTVNPAIPPSGTTFADVRDKTLYRKVTIGTQVWMAENLRYDDDKSDTSDVCYGNSADSCEKYGRLYNFAAALGACPAGWHLPSDAEWATLIAYAGGAAGAAAGTKLKSPFGWKSGVTGTDIYGFAAVPGGYGLSDGNFLDAGSYGHWWSATEINDYNGWYRYIRYDVPDVVRLSGDKTYLFSVRCVED